MEVHGVTHGTSNAKNLISPTDRIVTQCNQFAPVCLMCKSDAHAEPPTALIRADLHRNVEAIGHDILFLTFQVTSY